MLLIDFAGVTFKKLPRVSEKILKFEFFLIVDNVTDLETFEFGLNAFYALLCGYKPVGARKWNLVV